MGPDSESDSESGLDGEHNDNEDCHYTRPLNVRVTVNERSEIFQYCHPAEDETVVISSPNIADIQSNSVSALMVL